LREIAAYSANLFLLRLACEPAGGQIGLRNLLQEPAISSWRQIVMLWRSGLGTEGWHATLSFLDPVDPTGIRRGSGPTLWRNPFEEMTYYHLIGDVDAQENYAIGAVVNDGLEWQATDWYVQMRTWLVAAAAGYSGRWQVQAPPPGTARGQITEIYRLIARFMTQYSGEQAIDQRHAELMLLLAKSPDHRLSVAMVVCRRAVLLDRAPELREPSLYSGIPMAAMMDATCPDTPAWSWQSLRESLPEPAPGDTARALGLLIER
jgi:hypothetical protein